MSKLLNTLKNFKLMRRYSNTVIKTLLEDRSKIGTHVEINGWITSVRQHKNLTFLHMYDGLSSGKLQVVAPTTVITSDLKARLNYGASIQVRGQLSDSPGDSQSVEVKAREISLLGDCHPSIYPFTANNSSYSEEYVRSFLHLRSKKPDFAANLRVRSRVKKHIHDLLHDQDYIQIDTPIITSNDCEGGGDAFEVRAARIKSDKNEDYFGSTTGFLTVSAQLHLEAINAGISKVYSFGPTFRADNAVSRHHLAEFYMLEAEIAFIDNVEQLCDIIERIVRDVATEVLGTESGDIAEFDTAAALECMTKSFHTITYTEAIKLLQNMDTGFDYEPIWGADLYKEHEKALVSAHDNSAVFVTDWPASLKPFYALLNPDGKTVACVDLLVPGVGELVGGSLREHRYDALKAKLEENQLENLDWYLDLRQFGTVPHGGYGLGFERLLQFLLGIKQIRDTIPFPRYTGKLVL